jgi:hypothetical protein
MLPSLEDDLRGAVSLKRNSIPEGDSVPEGDNVLEGDNILEGENIKRLHSALVDLHSAILVCPQEPSLYRFCEQPQD